MSPRRDKSDSDEIPPLVPGFRASGVHAGIKEKDLDLALIASDVPANVAGVFTKSSVPGAPVIVSKQRVGSGRVRAIVANSGCSNVATGARGLRHAEETAARAAAALDCPEEQVLVASTGVIGEPLPIDKIRAAMPGAVEALAEDGLPTAASAIMTTDTIPKVVATRTRIDRRWVHIAGIAKGSGMIEPNMATLLAFIVTDAAVAPRYLRRLLADTADETFNRVTIDGEGSTSDMALLLANGVAGNSALRGGRSSGARRFERALGEVCGELARELARDGEGATKLVTVRVSGARSKDEAERAARRIANSMLVKTAVFGADPNWGRILQTIGAGEVKIDESRAEVRLCGIPVFRSGSPVGGGARDKAAEALEESEVLIELKLGVGRGEAQLWTCDLSYDYVRINAEYTT